MDTGVRDLEVAFFKANSTWFDDKCSKDLSNQRRSQDLYPGPPPSQGKGPGNEVAIK